jgi:hypothetical protein
MTDETEATRARLEESAGPVLFSDLRAHLARDAVLLVSPRVSIVECGVAIARDDAPAVERWITSGELRRPTAEERAAWAASTDARWTAVVVQPFVLVQEIEGT